MKTHLVFAIMTIALLAFVISQTGQKTAKFDTVIGIAQERARGIYHAPAPISEPLRALNYDQVRDIRFREDETLWRKEGLPFQARFFFAAGGGDLHSPMPVTIYEVNRESSRQIPFSPVKFTFGPLVNLSAKDQASGQYSGLRLYYPLNKPGQLDETLVFQGASYFRPLAKAQQYGLSARGITVDTLGKENFPSFTQFWLVKPGSNATEMVLYALLEGRDLTGAYEFRVAPGSATRIHVRAVLFPRLIKNSDGEMVTKTVKDIGFAPLTSMYWYGENTSNTFGGWRPEVHDSDGLQIQRSNGEWVWHPLSWAKQRQINVFSDKNPKGFGLLQRDRDFSHYQDLEANYHSRPSAWIQPDGDWNAGSVILMQNPTGDEFADNIVAYWRPDSGLSARIDFAYSINVFSEDNALPALGRCISTRIDYQNEEYFRQVVLIFEGGELDQIPPEAGIAIDKPPEPHAIEPGIWAGKNGAISKISVQRIPNTGRWQVSFTVSTAQTNQPIEIGCRLGRDGRPITETWTYTWVK